MIKVYYNLVKNGKWDIEDVPTLWRDGVQALLDEASNDAESSE